jgi:peptidoglycan/xylan/chitin deacetylase (PgdA/CDA1 family)
MKLSQAEQLAALALFTALPLFFFSPYLAILPLLLFLLACFIAPFCPRWSFFLPLISRGKSGSTGIALSFDDGPSPHSTPIILKLLKRYNYHATFFVIGEKAKQFPGLIAAIVADGHTIGNHSWSHDNLLMLRSPKRLHQDIHRTQVTLGRHGITPRFFRPPVGITSSRLRPVLDHEQLLAVTFSCRAFDRGNKRVSGMAQRILSCLHPGAIVLLHDLPPQSEKATRQWQQELSLLFKGLQQSDLPVLPLGELIDRDVMGEK